MGIVESLREFGDKWPYKAAADRIELHITNNQLLEYEITTLRQQLEESEKQRDEFSVLCGMLTENGLDTFNREAILQEQLAQYKADAEHKQSVIDNLMLEYCPNEMTLEQIKTWAENQVPVSAEEQAAIDSAIAGKIS